MILVENTSCGYRAMETMPDNQQRDDPNQGLYL